MFSINSKTILDPHPGAGIMGVSHQAATELNSQPSINTF